MAKATGLDPKLHGYLIEHRSADDAVLEALREETREATGARAGMQVAPEQGTFLRILVAAIGSPQFVTGDMVQEGVVVIDVGINRVDAPERKRGYRLVGDVDYDAVSAKAEAITPVPGGVGPMTIAMLLYNTLKAAQSATDVGRSGG